MTSIANPQQWPNTLEEAKVIQQQLCSKVSCKDQLGPIHYVAGVDVGFTQNNRICRAAVAVLRFPSLELVEYQLAERPCQLPYIPGFLSFRECPAILQALSQLQTNPDLLLCDGQGIAHPRRFGIACHLGVLTAIPAIGVAKSRLIGQYLEPGEHKGDWQPLIDQGETIGAILRTREGVKPLYISSGHMISLESAINYVLACTTKYRLPETTRWADGLASQRPATIKRLKQR